MKKSVRGFFIAIVVSSTIAVVQGCDNFSVGNHFLHKPPTVNSTLDTVFTHANYAKQYLFRTYRSLPYGEYVSNAPYDTYLMRDDPLANITDIGQSYGPNGGDNNYYYPGSYTASVAANNPDAVKFNFYNSGAWDGIRKSYIFLENVDKVPDMDSATKIRLKAEARLIIAIQYTRLFRNYGGVPWVDHAYGPNENFKLPRLTARATLDSTVAMINSAIPNLPYALDSPSTESGRLTQAGAMGLKCRILLFGASPLFNSNRPYMQGEAADQKLVWYGGEDPSLWQDAEDACGALIDKVEANGVYHLADTGNPRQDFRHAYYDRDSPELLISTRKVYQSDYFASFLRDRGSVNTTDNYVKMFPMANGMPITQNGSGYDPSYPYQNRDPRLYETVLVNGDDFQNRTAQLWIGGNERESKGVRATRTGYRQKKFLLDLNNIQGHVRQWPYLRLPEIYLSYAEARNEAMGGPDAQACKYVSKVRNRVDLGDLKNCTSLSKEEFRKAVIHERALEFGYEEVRWYDIIRWKMEDVFTKTLYGMNICKKGASYQGCSGSYGPSGFLFDRFEIAPRYWKNHFSPKWYLSAFPETEILKQYGLVQNPGW